ncbi:hypothetical protein Tco_0125555, partial [Tanacetum coccineum]
MVNQKNKAYGMCYKKQERAHGKETDQKYVKKNCLMAQQQHAVGVHPDELCPPNKRYDLMDANKKVELNLTLDDFRTIFHFPQATDNNHNSFVPPPSFSEMVPFYKQVSGFTMELKTPSSFKTTGLLQPWKTSYTYWMITDEMKQTEHYRMYTKVFGVDVPLTQSQPTESTHGT